MKYRKSLPKKKKKKEKKNHVLHTVVKYFSPVLYQFLLLFLPNNLLYRIVKEREREKNTEESNF